MLRVSVQRLPHAEGLPLPTYATEGAAGADLYAAERTIIPAGGWNLVKTGLRIQLPPGYEAQIRPRSGLAMKYGITVLNTPGTIDEDYRGEIGVLLMNHSASVHPISRGDRIAQMVIAPVQRAAFEFVTDLDASARGEGGFGSTGVS